MFAFASRLGICILLAACSLDLGAAEPALTIYNQDFAVVRQSVPLALKAGVNQIAVNDTTVHLEPDSVMLRDPAGKIELRILEQNFRADPISQGLLLSLFEGKMIDFKIQEGDQVRTVAGKIVRSGYVPHQAGMERYGGQYGERQMAYGSGSGSEPIIEIEGRLRFGLPGTPLFPSLGDDSILKPTLTWQLESAAEAQLQAELSYVTGGMSWEADYNIAAAEKGDKIDLTGWVTMDNQSGKTFEQAHINLMAGDVSKLKPQVRAELSSRMAGAMSAESAPPVSEKTFDEYHLYTLKRPATLYVYEGAWINPQQYGGWNMESIRENPTYGTESNPKIWVMREFKNSKENHLGMPLPKGRMRFYRRDTGGALEFTGENMIDHTPADETIRVYTGNAFDLFGERRRTQFNVNQNEHSVDEAFEIKLRNHKKEPAAVRVVERLYRWNNWQITEKSHPYTKLDSQKIEFPVDVKPDGEVVITYRVHYSW